MKEKYFELYKDIEEGKVKNIYWNDPDDGLSSGVYEIYDFGEFDGEHTVLNLTNDYSEVDVYISECKRINE